MNHKNSYWIKEHALKSFGRDTECLVVGMSHAAYGVAADYLSCSTINLANMSQSIGMDSEIIKKAIRVCPKLKLVVMDISYHSLYYSVFSTPGEPWRDCYSWLYLGVSEAKWWQRLCDVRYFVPSILFGTNRVWRILRYRLKDKLVTDVDESNWITPHGWIQVYSAPTVNDEEGAMRVRLHEKQCRQEYFKRNLASMDEVLRLCKEHHIKVLFLTPPVWKTYSSRINKVRWENCRSIISAFCKKYNCSYADFLKDNRFDLADFVDDDHLSVGGALKFTKMLEHDYLDKLLANK